MMVECAVHLASTTLWLLGARALYWPPAGMLCIADAHFGKAAAFRAHGLPVPIGTTADTLTRLDVLLERYPVRHLVFLGDFLHARAAHGATRRALLRWRARHPELRCSLVRGNHDVHAGDPVAELGLAVTNEPLMCGPLALLHVPRLVVGAHAIAGHIHPVFVLRGKAHQRVRLPCFVHAAGLTVLPAFGAFTGGHALAPTLQQQIFLADGEAVWPVVTMGCSS